MSGRNLLIQATVGLVLVLALIGAPIEARNLQLTGGYAATSQNLAYTPPLQQQQAALNALPINRELADLDSDNDDDDDGEMKSLIAGAAENNQATVVDDPLSAQGLNSNTAQYQPQAAASVDLKTSASHHHHGHGAKGWLDMGAWTGKKGSFGWYDKHPVGKGK